MSAPRDPVRVFQLLLAHPAIVALTDAAQSLGVDAHLVGGILRDRFLGLPSHDLDAMVSARGRAVAERLAEVLDARFIHLGGKSFGAYRLVLTRNGQNGYSVLDLWDREGTSVDQDLARRDFTVNAVSLSTPEGALYDPFGGLDDLRHRLLRATTPESFTGDPLRVLRLPRLLAQLPGFSTDPPTLELARTSAPALVEVASERVRDELEQLFSKPEPHRAVAILDSLDLYPGLWVGRPGEEIVGTDGTRARTGGVCGELAQLAPCALRLRQIADGPPPFPIDHRIARLALTFAHLDTLSAGTDPHEALDRFAAAGYLTRQQTAAVAQLLEQPRMPHTVLERRRFLHSMGELWTTCACFAGARAAGDPSELARWDESVAALVALDRREGATIRNPPRLLDGSDIGALLGVSPGPAIGRATAALKAAQVDGRVTTVDEAKRLVRGIT